MQELDDVTHVREAVGQSDCRSQGNVSNSLHKIMSAAEHTSIKAFPESC